MRVVRIPSAGGFTKIELLVSLAVIGILIAMLLPAVQAARDAARRTTCISNLRQMGLALHNYEAAHGVFPPGKIAAHGRFAGTCEPEEVEVDDNPGNCTEFLSWTALCLPYLEYPSLSTSYRFDQPWCGQTNRPVVATPIALFQCPATPDPARADMHFVRGAAATDYGSIHQVERLVYTDVFGVGDPGLSARQGALAKHIGIGANRIGDGLSKTLMVSECAGRPISYVRSAPMTAAQFPRYTDDEIVEIDGRFVPEDGIGWADPDAGFDVKGVTENGLQVYGGRMINGNNVGHSYSFHRGGAQFLLADGSVQFVREDIDPWVYVAFCTRAGGEVVPDF